jgi:hypothetical protein
MSARRIISLSIGALVSLATLTAGLAFIFLGDYYAPKDRLIVASISLAPLALVSVMVGYAVWWLVLFLLTLVLPGGDRENSG